MLLNPPSVWLLRAPAWPHAGWPLLCEMQSQFVERFEWRWYRVATDVPPDMVRKSHPALWAVATLVGTEARYVPSEADVDHLLLCEVTAFAGSLDDVH